MHRHPQPACGRAVHKRFRAAAQLAMAGFQVNDRLLHPNAHIPCRHARRRKPLGSMLKPAFWQPPKAVDFGNGRADLNGQHIQNLLRHVVP